VRSNVGSGWPVNIKQAGWCFNECAVDRRIDENIDQLQLPRSDRLAEH